MAKAKKHGEPEGELSKAEYEDALYALQVELVKLQKHLIEGGERIVVLLEGRDAARHARIISADRPLRAKDRNMIGCRAPRRLA